VVDFSQWFPTSANPRNSTAGDDAFKRYTDGNEIVPLVDGRNMLREVYRAIRATHVVESYDSDDHVPALDPSATPITPAPELQAKAKILLTNAWIDADSAMLGRRAMIPTSRTQTDPMPDIEALVASAVVLGALPPGNTDDLVVQSDSLADYRLWWLVPTLPVPPGTYLQIRQFAFADALRGDDPRLPGVLLGEDIYGVLAPLGGSAVTGAAFAGTTGRCVVPVLLKNGEPPCANVRLVSWSPDEDDPAPATLTTSGKGTKRILASGELTLPVPPNVDLQARPVFSRAGVQSKPEMLLEFDGAPSRAVVVIARDAVSATVPVVVVNQRSGEVVTRTVAPSTTEDIRIPIEPLSSTSKTTRPNRSTSTARRSSPTISGSRSHRRT
jgi:hypothetical protein